MGPGAAPDPPRRRAAASRTASPTPLPARAPPPPAGPEPTLFTPDFWQRVGDGATERSYEAHTVATGGHRLPIRETAIGIGIGLVFALVNVWLGMQVGFVVGLSLYLSYFLGTALRWSPSTINYAAGASTGASQVVLPLALIYPALWVLGSVETPLVVLLGAAGAVAGILGVLFFFVYRRLWLIERPLPYPGAFHSSMLFMEAAQRGADRGSERSARLLLLVLAWGGAAFVFALIRDLTVGGVPWMERPVLDRVLPDSLYDGAGTLLLPFDTGRFPAGVLSLSLTFAAVGWFIGLRVASVLLAGALFVPLLITPLAPASSPSFVLLAAFAIAGAGATLLARHRRLLVSAARDLTSSRTADPLAPPRRVVLAAFALGLAAFTALFAALGLGVIAALATGLAVLLAVPVLGAMAVHITGTTTIQPLSPFAILLTLLLAALGGSDEATTVVAITVFGFGLVMATDTLFDFKMALYLGNPPREQAKAQWWSLVPGLVVGLVFSTWLLRREGISPATPSTETLPLPFAGAFAGIASFSFPGGLGSLLLLLAAGLGASLELATGLGTLFGLGMILSATRFALLGTLVTAALVRHLLERGGGARDPQRSLVVVAGMFLGEVTASVVTGLAA